MNHVCPMVTGTTPHVGGPIVGPGASNVLVNGKPVSLIGDSCICCGPPDVIVQGAPSVLINGAPAVTQGCMTAHGGTIPMGDPTVLIGSASPVTMKHKSPKRNKFLAAMSGNSLKEAITNQDKLQEEATQQEPMVYNLRWERDGVRIASEQIDENAKMVADTINIPDGDTVKIAVAINSEDNVIKEVEATVKDGMIEVGWDVLYKHFEDK